MKSEELAGASPKSSSFGTFISNRTEVQNCHEFGWKNHGLISLLVSCLFWGREKKIKIKEQGTKEREMRGEGVPRLRDKNRSNQLGECQWRGAHWEGTGLPLYLDPSTQQPHRLGTWLLPAQRVGTELFQKASVSSQARNGRICWTNVIQWLLQVHMDPASSFDHHSNLWVPTICQALFQAMRWVTGHRHCQAGTSQLGWSGKVFPVEKTLSRL